MVDVFFCFLDPDNAFFMTFNQAYLRFSLTYWWTISSWGCVFFHEEFFSFL